MICLILDMQNIFISRDICLICFDCSVSFLLLEQADLIATASKNRTKSLNAEKKVLLQAFRLARKSVWMYLALLVDLFVNTPIKPQ